MKSHLIVVVDCIEAKNKARSVVCGDDGGLQPAQKKRHKRRISLSK